MKKVLLVGDDLHLLVSRAAVLATQKLDVVSCTAGSLPTCARDASFDLIILCHSLHEYGYKAVSEIVRRRWPDTPILQILRSQFDLPTEFASEAVTLPQPEMLIDRVMYMLGDLGPRLLPERRLKSRSGTSKTLSLVRSPDSYPGDS